MKSSTATAQQADAGFSATIRDYVALTKPRITLLVLVTEFSGLWLAQRGLPELGILFWTLLGTAFASGSSCVFNNVVDAEIDAIMARTAGRPLPSGRLQKGPALIFGAVLGVAAIAVLAYFVNWQTAALGAFTIFFYVVVYTMWLKRTTPLCTSIGGIAGALPPVMGWTAVSPVFSIEPVVLFAILYVWQPPHFWALAIARAEEYRAANIPMLPVVKGNRVTKRQMLIYTVGLFPVVSLPYFVGMSSWVYLIVGMVATAEYLRLTIQFARRPVEVQQAKKLFFFSIMYIAVVYLAIFIFLVPA